VTDTHTKSMIACNERFNRIRMVIINTTESQRPLVMTSVDSKQATVDYGYQSRWPESGTQFWDLDLSLINTSWYATVLTTI
jgi:hypothetical protein